MRFNLSLFLILLMVSFGCKKKEDPAPVTQKPTTCYPIKFTTNFNDTIINEYNNNNKISKVIEKSTSSTYQTIYTYDEQQRIQSINNSYDGTIIQNYTYPNNYRIQIDEEHVSSGTKYRLIHYLEPDGSYSRTEYYKEIGLSYYSYTGKKEYHYVDGNIITATEYDSQNKIKYISSYTYDDKKYISHIYIFYSFPFPTKNNVTKVTTTEVTTGFIFTHKFDFKYNSDGYATSITLDYDKSGTPPEAKVEYICK